MIALLIALSIAFPREGQKLPAVSRCYVIGSSKCSTIKVQGECVEVYRTGAWATMIEVHPGKNKLVVEEPDGSTVWTRNFEVAAPKAADSDSGSERVYQKLEYAGDVAKKKPNGVAGVKVVLDPGHGGKDAGAFSPHGWAEKMANLSVAKKVADELRSRGIAVTMTREDDVAVELYDRPKIAFADNADVFVSIHHNAPGCDKDPRESRYHAVYAWNAIGEDIARAINLRMDGVMGIKNSGVIHANFAVTRNPEIPSCLVEVDFMTSPESEEAVFDEARQGIAAKAIADGIIDWCGK